MAAANLTVRISAQIADLQREMKQATSTVDRFVGDFDRSVTKAAIVGNVLGGAISAIPGLVSGAIRSFVSFSSQLTDLSERTGLAIRDLQRFSHAGELVGVGLDQVTQAVAQMQNRLAGGDASAVGAVQELGLSFAALRQLNPSEQFEAIASRIAAIQDPAERTRIAMDIFGRSGSAIMALLRTDIKKVGDSFEAMGGVIDDATVKAGDDLGDLFTRIKGFGLRLTAEALRPLLDTIKQMNDPAEVARWEKFKKSLLSTAEIQSIRQLAAAFDALRVARSGDVLTPKTPVAGLTGLGPIAMPKMTATQLKAVYDELADGLKKNRDEMDRATKAADAYRDSVTQLRQELSGERLQGEVRKLHDAFKGLLTQGPLSAAQFDRVGDAAKRLFTQGATLTPELFRILLASQRLTPELEELGDAFFASSTQVRMFYDSSVPLLPLVRGIGAEVGEMIPVDFPPQVAAAIKRTQEFRQGISDLRQALDFLAAGSGGGSFGQVVQELANVVAAFEAGQKAADQYRNALTAAEKAAALLAGAGAIAQATGTGSTAGRVLGGAAAGAQFGTAILPGWGTAIGAGVGAVVGLFRGMAASDEAVKQAAANLMNLKLNLIETYGSMARLQTIAEMVGLSFTDAFKLRGKDGLDQLAHLTDALTEKQAKLNAAMEEYGFTWEDTGQKFKQLALTDLAQTLLEKTQLLQGAGIDYNTILERQADSYSQLVQAALRTGTEIPIALQDTLQKLVDMGKLVDADGKAFADLEDITWAKTLTQGFRDVTDAIHELTHALTRGVGGALDELSRRRVTIPVGYDVEDITDMRERIWPERSFAGGTHGRYVDFGAGTTVRLHGLERVMTPGEEDLPNADGDLLIQNQVILDGRVIDERMDRVARQRLATGAWRPRMVAERAY